MDSMDSLDTMDSIETDCECASDGCSPPQPTASFLNNNSNDNNNGNGKNNYCSNLNTGISGESESLLSSSMRQCCSHTPTSSSYIASVSTATTTTSTFPSINEGSLLAPTPTHAHANTQSPFMIGVVEGFYGKPYSAVQRCDMFGLMNGWGMNTYLYAPKNDRKHRAEWRSPYNGTELGQLSELLSEAKANNIEFIYAVSPGLDMIYSSQHERDILQTKLQQVQQLGCNSFALLFDDIDACLSEEDEPLFESFAHAHCEVANYIFNVMTPQRLLFCPTEYCASFASPTVVESEYLRTVGKRLNKLIHFMWTGDAVISRLITDDALEELHSVVGRKCVIWDNLHANDYDRRRLFMGSYSGRSFACLKYIDGVVTNPGCEYPAIFVSLHTLAAWLRHGCNYSESDAYAQAVADWVPLIAREDTQRSCTHHFAHSTSQTLQPNSKCSCTHANAFTAEKAITNHQQRLQENNDKEEEEEEEEEEENTQNVGIMGGGLILRNTSTPQTIMNTSSSTTTSSTTGNLRTILGTVGSDFNLEI
eukprot:m.109867 g.109867  ORF g.109867 m.109867 type:complete len:535 (-) comp12741_c0_seq8:55-1659(-)